MYFYFVVFSSKRDSFYYYDLVEVSSGKVIHRYGGTGLGSDGYTFAGEGRRGEQYTFSFYEDVDRDFVNDPTEKAGGPIEQQELVATKL
jgi:hypothetical protein